MNFTLSRFFAPQDPIDQQLDQLRKQGSGMARAAHLCATMLVVLFSAGSFVALGSDALHSVLVQWQTTHQLDIPSAISLCVSTLMVLAMDVAMLSAAATLRLLASRRAEIAETLLHVAVMAGVCILESGTYLYMSWTYEHPVTTAAGALIVARALAAPLLAIYLASRRVLPITSRDILAASEIAAGAGVLRDVTTAARDQLAPLDRKMRLYGAAAVMTPGDRTRLDYMIAAVVEEPPSGPVRYDPRMSQGPYTRAQEASGVPQLAGSTSTGVPRLSAPDRALGEPDDDGTRPPTGPGSPSAAPVRTPRSSRADRATVVRLDQPEEWRREAAAQASGRRAHRPRVRTPGKAKDAVEARVRKVWRPGMTIGMLERAAGISHNSAGKWRKVMNAEAQDPGTTEEVACGDVSADSHLREQRLSGTHSIPQGGLGCGLAL